ncbi:hypothetical protein Tco_1396045 [Tanacetum coccineum]
MGQLGVVTSWKLMERAVVQSKAGGFSYDRSVAATDINRRSTIADMEQRNVVMNTDSSIYYLGCIRSIGDVLPFRDANKGQSYWRKVDIKIIDRNIVEFTMWDNLAKQFNKDEIEKTPPPGLRFTCEAMITAVKENRVALRIMQPMQQGNGARRHLHLYNFNAAVTDGTASAQFTFFMNAGEQFTGHPCLQLAQKYKGTSLRQLPTKIVNIIDKTRLPDPLHTIYMKRHR